MISYKDFIKLMEERGYTYKNQITIDESNSNVKIFPVKEQTIGKALELQCPNNIIISACGKDLGCNNSYFCNIKFFNQDNKEAFQDLHYSIALTENYHVAMELVITKVMQKPPDQNNPDIQKYAHAVNPILKIINSDNPCEYPMWSGIYKLFSNNNIDNNNTFLNHSFNLYAGEKMIFYAINPDIDITKVRFELKADILEYDGGITNDTKQIH